MTQLEGTESKFVVDETTIPLGKQRSDSQYVRLASVSCCFLYLTVEVHV
jgi:hypothetical protein